MKIAYVSENDSSDIKAWSGLDFFIKNALASQENVELYTIDKLTNKYRVWIKIKKLLYNITGKRYQAMREPMLLKDYAKQITDRLKPDTDCIFAPSSMPVSYLETNIPIFFYTDANFDEMKSYYSSYVNLCAETQKDGFLAEKQALENATLAFYASDWAVNSAMKHYGVAKEKVKVIPFGANILDEPNLETIKININNRDFSQCDLLFIGVDFERKGGKLAFEVAKNLNNSGVKTKLHIVGIPNLSTEFQQDFVINYGFLNKNIESEKEILNKLFVTSNYLIVPSEAEAYGLVYCEANAYGIPAIGTITGGIPTIIKNDINGWIFEKSDFAKKCSDKIKENFRSEENYKKIALSSFNEYKSRLNWKVSGKRMIELMQISIDKKN
jgi:glycosyltransferase involved in cell wall biosynthesis